MKIGLTYDLRSWYLDRGYSMEDTAEFDKQETVDAIDNVLKKMGFETEAVGNCFELIEALSAGKRWDLVFNIAEGLYGDGRESVVPAILDQYRIPYVFSGPVILGVSLNKYLTRLIVSAAGVPVSPGFLISDLKDADKCELNYPLFIKPVSEGTGKGITEKSLVRSEAELKSMAAYLLERFEQPALVEEYLPGREFTVGIAGSGEDAIALGGMEIECRDNLPYSVELKENYQLYCKYTPIGEEYADECREVALKAWKALGAVDGGRVDVKADRNGKICFIEVNPLAGLNPVHSDLPILSRMSGTEYQTLLEMIMNSALKRHGLKL
ncbi:MAG TPA: ATP-grasp domain-containing protein [Bacteroidales bacterium]|nr:ATP-grasp domain-containing protein [Bacteroidales bacterium]